MVKIIRELMISIYMVNWILVALVRNISRKNIVVLIGIMCRMLLVKPYLFKNMHPGGNFACYTQMNTMVP